MRIVISFHSPSPWQVRKAGLLCLITGVVVAAILAGIGWTIHADMSRWSDSLQALKARASPRVARLDENAEAEIKTELQAANQIIERLNTPWSVLFASLEGVYSENAILLGVEPDPVSRSVRLMAESKDPASMLEFVRQLRAAKIFGDAYVVSHVINQGDMQRPIRFSVSSHWLDVVPDQAVAGTKTEEEKTNQESAPTAQQAVNAEGGAL